MRAERAGASSMRSAEPRDVQALNRRLAQLNAAMGIEAPPRTNETVADPTMPTIGSVSRPEAHPLSALKVAAMALPIMALAIWWGVTQQAINTSPRGQAQDAQPASATQAAGTVSPTTPTEEQPAKRVETPASGTAKTATREPAQAQVAEPPAQANAAQADPNRTQEQLRARVESWRSAWASRDIEAYLAHYSPHFKAGKGQSHNSWEASRRRILARPVDIELGLTQLELAPMANDRWQARFLQDYRAGAYAERELPKTLELALENGRWNIVSERTGTSAQP